MKEFDDILDKYKKIFYQDGFLSSGTAINIEDVKEIMETVHNNALDKAAENAEVVEKFQFEDEITNEMIYSHEVDKNSILKLKM